METVGTFMARVSGKYDWQCEAAGTTHCHRVRKNAQRILAPSTEIRAISVTTDRRTGSEAARRFRNLRG